MALDLKVSVRRQIDRLTKELAAATGRLPRCGLQPRRCLESWLFQTKTSCVTFSVDMAGTGCAAAP